MGRYGPFHIAKTLLKEIGSELQNLMRDWEEVVSNTRQYVNKIQDNASRNIKDLKAVEIYGQLRTSASYERKLFVFARKFLELAGSGGGPD